MSGSQPTSLPPKANLEWLRGAARDLLKMLKRGEGAERLAVLPADVRRRGPTLTLAQAVVARELGFASWPKLKAAVEAQGERRAARQAAKPPSKTRALAMADAEAMIAAGRAGDPAALASRRMYGRAVGMMTREILEGRPDDYRAVLDTCLAGLSHPNANVRFESAHAADFFGDEGFRGPLVALLEDPVPRVRRMAAHALACDACKSDLFGDDPAIRRRLADMALGDPSIQVRRHAVVAVAQAGGPEAAATLRAVAARESDATLLRNVRWGLSNLERRSAGD